MFSGGLFQKNFHNFYLMEIVLQARMSHTDESSINATNHFP